MNEDYFIVEPDVFDISSIFSPHDLLPKYTFPIKVGKQLFHYYAIGNKVYVEIIDEKNMNTINGFTIGRE